MFQIGRDWNPKQAKLKTLLSASDAFPEAIAVCLELHALVHAGSSEVPTFFDEVVSGLTREVFAAMPTPEDNTIAWDIWHITRIEDLVAGILIANGPQTLDAKWLSRMGVSVRDTGNAMTDEEILALSGTIDMSALFLYRVAVGRRTRKILRGLAPTELKRKPLKESLARILKEGGVTQHPDSVWLLDFWGKKNVAGLLTMPITRHQAVHLNDCVNLKRKLPK